MATEAEAVEVVDVTAQMKEEDQQVAAENEGARDVIANGADVKNYTEWRWDPQKKERITIEVEREEVAELKVIDEANPTFQEWCEVHSKGLAFMSPRTPLHYDDVRDQKLLALHRAYSQKQHLAQACCLCTVGGSLVAFYFTDCGDFGVGPGVTPTTEHIQDYYIAWVEARAEASPPGQQQS